MLNRTLYWKKYTDVGCDYNQLWWWYFPSLFPQVFITWAGVSPPLRRSWYIFIEVFFENKEAFVLKWGAPVVQPIGEGRILVEAVESWPGSALILFGKSRAHDVAINRWQLEAIRLLITPTWIYSLQARQEIAAKRCHFPNLLRQKNQQFRLIFLECSQFWWDWTCSLLVGAPHMLPTITSREYFLTSLVWEGKFDLF